MNAWRNDFRLDLRLYYSESLFDGQVLEILRDLLLEHAPSWCSGAYVHVDAEPPVGVGMDRPSALLSTVRNEAVRRGALYTALEADFGNANVSPMRQLGSIELRGGDSALIVLIDADQKLLVPHGDAWLWGNRVSMQICRRRLDGVDAIPWVLEFFRCISDLTSPVYGHAETSSEFRSKNIIIDADGIRVVGVDFMSGLPGLYWLNLFGAPYVELMGRERLLSCPAFQARVAGSGVLLCLSPDACDWNSEAYRALEQSVLNCLGKEHFFLRDEPGRILTAPDWKTME